MDKGSKKADQDLAKQTEKKVLDAKKFLHERGLAPNIYNLLGIVGATFLEDFAEINDDLLAEIEKEVRDPKFCGDGISKSERSKYFGHDSKEARLFAFTFLDRRKLKKVAEDIHKRQEDSSLASSEASSFPVEESALKSACGPLSQLVKKTRKRKFAVISSQSRYL